MSIPQDVQGFRWDEKACKGQSAQIVRSAPYFEKPLDTLTVMPRYIPLRTNIGLTIFC
jgi:hypothetical protein